MQSQEWVGPDGQHNKVTWEEGLPSREESTLPAIRYSETRLPCLPVPEGWRRTTIGEICKSLGVPEAARLGVEPPPYDEDLKGWLDRFAEGDEANFILE
jgi:hypothetical protein